MRRWLARLGFSLIVIAAVLAWEIHKGTQNGTLSGVKQGLYVAAAILCFSLGAAGMKERHRRDPGA
jgi:hypothetical protein